MLEGFRSFLTWLLSLRWLEWRGRSLVLPVTMLLVVVQWSSWAATPVARLPFAVDAVALVLAVLAGRTVAIETVRRGLGAISIGVIPGLVLAVGAGAVDWVAGGRIEAAVASAAIAVAYLAGVVVGGDGRRSIGQVALMAEVVSIWLLYDVSQWADMRLNDLHVYLDSADRWSHGGAAYMTAPLHAFPYDPATDFALYPPPLLPVFAFLSRIPNAIVEPLWVAFLFACGFAALRAIGLRTSWSLLFLAFPPLAIGVASGNLTNVGFLLFALGGRAAPAALPLGAALKLQTAIPAFWLVRERRWRSLAAGLAALVAVAAVTLPIVGTGAWSAWWTGLAQRAQSQAFTPELFGSSYAKYLPAAAFVAVAIVAVAWAFWPSRRRGLAAFGLASIAASPIVWPHSFVFELPAVLFLRSGALVWLLLGAESFNTHVWGAFYVGGAAIFVARRLLPAADDLLHPLPAGPWADGDEAPAIDEIEVPDVEAASRPAPGRETAAARSR